MEKEKILVVDDEPFILDVCKKSLAGEGCEVLTAASGEEALDILNSKPVDLLITDISMPGISGKELLKKAKDIHPDMSEAVITGHSNMELAIETMKLGAQAFIVKPFTARELKSTVNHLMERNRLLRENLRLKEFDRIKSAFLGNMSHEFRTPLNAIIGFSELLLQDKRGKISPKQREDLRIISEKGQELLHLFENLIDASSLEGGSMKVRKEKVDLAELIEEVMRPFREKAEKKGVAIVTDISTDCACLMTDRYLISRVLKNLVDNALKFTRKGEITVSCRLAGKECIIKLKDTGIGVEHEKRGIIFDKFRQADEGDTRRFGGAGLGLYTARKMIELMDGEIGVESPPEGAESGSEFTVVLPV